MDAAGEFLRKEDPDTVCDRFEPMNPVGEFLRDDALEAPEFLSSVGEALRMDAVGLVCAEFSRLNLAEEALSVSAPRPVSRLLVSVDAPGESRFKEASDSACDEFGSI